jgi:hypothetical protein
MFTTMTLADLVPIWNPVEVLMSGGGSVVVRRQLGRRLR